MGNSRRLGFQSSWCVSYTFVSSNILRELTVNSVPFLSGLAASIRHSLHYWALQSAVNWPLAQRYRSARAVLTAATFRCTARSNTSPAVTQVSPSESCSWAQPTSSETGSTSGACAWGTGLLAEHVSTCNRLLKAIGKSNSVAASMGKHF